MACRCHIHVFSLGNEPRFGELNALNERTGTDGADLNIARKKANDIWFNIICNR